MTVRSDYKCESCGAIHEIPHPITDKPEIVCDQCNTPMFKLMSRVSFLARCSGFVGKLGEKK